jgi:hypothetical protein
MFYSPRIDDCLYPIVSFYKRCYSVGFLGYAFVSQSPFDCSTYFFYTSTKGWLPLPSLQRALGYANLLSDHLVGQLVSYYKHRCVFLFYCEAIFTDIY